MFNTADVINLLYTAFTCIVETIIFFNWLVSSLTKVIVTT